MTTLAIYALGPQDCIVLCDDCASHPPEGVTLGERLPGTPAPTIWCEVCECLPDGVHAGDPCGECGEHALHREGCSEIG